jgi:5-carboxymethyl-2-hydroxymuconate isomerase/acylpyruvate hydrolase
LLAAARTPSARARELSGASQATTAADSIPPWRDEATLDYLAPIDDADKFLCVGKNYRQHLEELQRTNLIKEIRREPTRSSSSTRAWSATRQGRAAEGIVRLDYEPELVFVIGRRALGVKRSEAIQLRRRGDDPQRPHRPRLAGARGEVGLALLDRQEHPGFGPLGPELITLDEIADPYDLWMTCSVNGELRMRVNTRDQIWKLPDIVEHFSRHIPIEPGDMFSTGAPGGVAVGKPNAAELFLKPGDVVECGIEGLATLRTTIVDAAEKAATP